MNKRESGCFVPSLVYFSRVVLWKFLFQIPSMYFGKVHGPFLNRLESPLPKDFYWNWPSGSGEINLSMYFLHLRKGVVYHFLYTWISFTHGWFFFEFGWNLPGGSDEEEKGNVISFFQTDRRRHAIRKGHMSFQLRWAKQEIFSQFLETKSSI